MREMIALLKKYYKDKVKELAAELADARKKPEKPEPGEFTKPLYKAWKEQGYGSGGPSKLLVDACKEIDRLTTENAKLAKAFEGCSKCKSQYEDELKAKDEKARLFRLEVQEAVEALIGCEEEKALEILEQALKGE